MEALQNLVSLLETENKKKQDYIVPASNMTMVEGKLIILREQVPINYLPTKIFHSQVSEKLHIPKSYYDRMMQSALPLLDSNVNHWLKDYQKASLIRTFEDEVNTARAFLSDRYSMVDNYEVLFETLEAIKQTGVNVEIVQAEMSETRMYLKVKCPDVEIKATELLKSYAKAIAVGSEIVSGFVLQNSEIGMGAFAIMPRAVVLACNNGMTMVKDQLKRVHLGSRMDELDFSKNDAVRRANLKLIKEQVKHAVKIFLSKQYLEKTVNHFTELGSKKIEAPVANVVEVIAKTYSIDDVRKANILNHFVEGGDMRRIGMFNAITEECQSLKDADLKQDSEVMSYEVLQNFNRIEAQAFKTKFTTN